MFPDCGNRVLVWQMMMEGITEICKSMGRVREKKYSSVKMLIHSVMVLLELCDVMLFSRR